VKRALTSMGGALALVATCAIGTTLTVPFTTVAVGNGPEDVLADVVDGKVFVVNAGSSSVSVIDPATWTRTTDIATGAGPRRMRLNGSTHKLYVVNSAGASVTVINPATNALVATIPLPGASNPWDLAIDEAHDRIYVPLKDANQVAVIDGGSDTLVTTVPTGTSPRAVCVNTASNRVFIPAATSGNVTVLNGATNVAVFGSPVAVGAGPTGCMVDPATNRIFVANDTDGTVTVIDGATLAAGAGIASGANTAVCGLNAETNLLVFANQGAGTLSFFALNNMAPLGTLSTGGTPFACLFDNPNNVLYVTNRTSSVVDVISLFDRSLVQQVVSSGQDPQGVALYHENVYVANQSGGGAGSAAVIRRFNLRDAGDLNKDGKADLVWRNTSDGSVAAWLMNGGTSTQSVIWAAPGSWSPVGKADLNGDGTGDVIWFNGVTHQTMVWYTSGLGLSASPAILNVPATWYPLLTGRFDGSRQNGIVWSDETSGQVSVSLMSPTGVAISYTKTIYAGSPSWAPVLAGNFDGDDHSDLVWANTDGSAAIWLMQGDAVGGISAKAATVILGPGTAWLPTFIGDFDGDGRSDIVWVNQSTGDTAIWLMNGTSPKPNGTAIVMPGASGWRVTQVADLDGDQKSDLIWRNSNTGATAAWLMNGLASKPSGAAILFTDPSWVALQTRNVRGLTQADMIWRNSSTGATAVWFMSGLFVTGSAFLIGPTPWNVVQYYPQ